MDWTLRDIPDWLITTGIALVAALGIFVFRYRFGIGEIQLQTHMEREKLLALYEKRIELLEEDAEDKSDQIRFLSAENADLRRRIRRLEEQNHVATGPE